MKLLRSIIALNLLLFVPLSAAAQRTAPEDSLVRLLKASKAQLITDSGIEYRRVTGDAWFVHNKTNLLCDSASWNLADNIIEAFGNVRLKQEGTVLTSDELTYYVEDDLAEFRGSLVEMVDKDGNRLRTRCLDYNTRDSVAVFQDGGSMKDKDGNVIESLTGIYDSKDRTFTFEESVKLYMDSIFLSTHRMVYNTDSSKAYFNYDTKVWLSDDGFVKADGGWYDRRDSIVFFNDKVYCKDKDNESWSEELWYFKKDNVVEMYNDVRILDSADCIALFGGKLRYERDSSLAFLLDNPAVARYGKNRDGGADTLFMRADSILFHAVRKCDLPEEYVAQAEKRREDVLFDALQELRTKQAEERKKKYEDAMRAAGKLPPLATDSTSVNNDGGSVSDDSSDGATPGKGLKGRKPRPNAKPASSGYAADSTASASSDAVPSAGDSDENAASAGDSTLILPSAPPDTTQIKIVTGLHNFKLFKKDLQAAGDSVCFTTLDSIAVLTGRPILWSSEKSQLTSDVMHLLVRNGGLYRGSMIDDARLAQQQDDEHFFNQVRSTEMMGFFRDNKLYRFDALGSVSAIFYMDEEGSLTNVNLKESKSLTAMVKENKVQRLLYLEEIKSDAYPLLQLERDRHKLKGFEWRGEERPVSRYSITDKVVPRSIRAAYSFLRRPGFNFTDEYFDDYMSRIYEEMEERKAEEHRRNLEEMRMKDSVRVADSLRVSDSLRVADSLSRTDSLNPTDSSTVRTAADTTLALKSATDSSSLKTTPAKIRREQRREAREERRKARLEAREARRKARLEAREEKRRARAAFREKRHESAS